MTRAHEPVAAVQRLPRGAHADEVRTDPVWIVLEPFDRPPERIIQMVYRPTGTSYAVRAVRTAPDIWHVAG